MRRKILIIFVLISFIITLAGCGNEAEKSNMDSQIENKDTVSLADNEDMTKEEAISIFTEAGYTIDKSGGIKNGSLYIDQ